MTDLTELRRLAEAVRNDPPWFTLEEAAFIARLDPQTVLGLLDTLDRYRAAIGKARQFLDADLIDEADDALKEAK